MIMLVRRLIWADIGECDFKCVFMGRRFSPPESFGHDFHDLRG